MLRKSRQLPRTRLTLTLPTMSMPSSPSPSASALISRASSLVFSAFVLMTAIFLITLLLRESGLEPDALRLGS